MEKYCLNIEFKNVDLNNYFIKTDFEFKKFHADLHVSSDAIEFHIHYDSIQYLGEKIGMWLKNISWEKFTANIELSGFEKTNNLQKIDLSESSVTSFKITNSLSYNSQSLIVLKIDSIKFYWESNKDYLNTGSFHFHDTGFKVVQPFYGILSPNDENNFGFSRMNGCEEYYTLEKSKFRPEFMFNSKDSKSKNVAQITKIPLITFKYSENISEKEAFHYGEAIKLIASFYFHTPIEYKRIYINLKEYSLVIINTVQQFYPKQLEGLHDFDIFWNFPKFLKANWQENILKNYNLLYKAIELFNQSSLVSDNSKFLIRYNIIEIFNKLPKIKDTYTTKGTKQEKKLAYQNALENILSTLEDNEHESFKIKWQATLPNLLKYKPMKGQLEIFLESQNIDISKSPITIKKLTELRNNITHGSLNKIDDNDLRKANILLYRISGILILSHLGINKWKLDINLDL